ncbi:acetyl-CoA carboxylase biotin carboxyl carrier protein [Aurantiacibacter aquimixticola]|nr:acetyl-CoA carboxylase biotin carboxyl carrier protein [Aurantiacibacter aquimixticola]
MSVDPALVRELAEMLSETGLTEIEVEEGSKRIRVARNVAAVAVAAPSMAAPAPAPAAAPSPAAAAEESPTPAGADNANAIKSPMVGTAYLAPEPGADNFVAIGDPVKKGDTLLIVEAMKVMNPISAEKDGTVQQLLIGNGEPVEFDQPLVIVA